MNVALWAPGSLSQFQPPSGRCPRAARDAPLGVAVCEQRAHARRDRHLVSERSQLGRRGILAEGVHAGLPTDRRVISCEEAGRDLRAVARHTTTVAQLPDARTSFSRPWPRRWPHAADRHGRSDGIADSIERLGPVEVQDIAFHDEITTDGHRYSLTVYVHDTDDESSGRRG